jgi:ATP-dependent Clp protease, protease subunit
MISLEATNMRTLYNIHPTIKVKKLEDLIKEPIIITVYEFTESSVKDFAKEMAAAENTGQTIIPIVIDSFGGYVYSELRMHDIIKECKVPVATIAMGKAMSCGALLFSAGTEGHRYMSKNSTLMIHDVSAGAWGKSEEIKVMAEEVERLNTLVYELISSNVGKSPKYFWDIVQEKGRADWYLPPDEALKHNLANHIKVPRFEINIDCKIEFTS